MAFAAKVILDSVGPNDVRLISVEATYPRFIHAEIMTHRDRARNAASSRAIPWKKYSKNAGIHKLDDPAAGLVDNCMFAMISRDPVIPMFLGKEQSGMQAGEELQGDDRLDALSIIDDMREYCLKGCDKLADLGLHKSIINRYVEPWMWITVLMTATEWKNFFRLRIHKDAERHFNHIATMIKDAIEKSTPRELKAGQWHLPYFDLQDAIEIARRGLHHTVEHAAQKVSAARCARLSYLTHDGVRDIEKDLQLGSKLIERDDVIHASALEHVAEASDQDIRSGPFRGWKQFRKCFPNENVPG